MFGGTFRGLEIWVPLFGPFSPQWGFAWLSQREIRTRCLSITNVQDDNRQYFYGVGFQ